jgi:prepilin-type N-terminal cleavage/methylation domain-containing protein
MPVPHLYHDFLKKAQRKLCGFSLLEVLVTLALITLLISLIIPCWGVISRSRARQAATAVVMESLEQARYAAITKKTDVWVIFRHTEGLNPDALRVLARQASVSSPLTAWQPLPKGTSFYLGEDTLMKERPPEEVLTSSLNGSPPPSKDLFGAIMFQRSARIGVPLFGGNSLVIQLASPSGIAPGKILLSRATGRATFQ